MADREKIIKTLSEMIEGREDEEGWEPTIIPLIVVRDIVEMLREQEREEDDGK